MYLSFEDYTGCHHVYMHNSTEPGSGPQMLLSFVCWLFRLQSRSLSCLTLVPHSGLEACWVNAEWLPVLLFLVHWLGGPALLPPIMCEHACRGALYPSTSVHFCPLL